MHKAFVNRVVPFCWLIGVQHSGLAVKIPPSLCIPLSCRIGGTKKPFHLVSIKDFYCRSMKGKGAHVMYSFLYIPTKPFKSFRYHKKSLSNVLFDHVTFRILVSNPYIRKDLKHMRCKKNKWTCLGPPFHERKLSKKHYFRFSLRSNRQQFRQQINTMSNSFNVCPNYPWPK